MPGSVYSYLKVNPYVQRPMVLYNIHLMFLDENVWKLPASGTEARKKGHAGKSIAVHAKWEMPFK